MPHSTGASYPLLVARADGRLDVFFQTPQQHLFHLQRAANGAWAAPNDLGQLFMTTGGATLDTDGTQMCIRDRARPRSTQFAPTAAN